MPCGPSTWRRGRGSSAPRPSARRARGGETPELHRLKAESRAEHSTAAQPRAPAGRADSGDSRLDVGIGDLDSDLVMEEEEGCGTMEVDDLGYVGVMGAMLEARMMDVLPRGR